MRRFRVAFFLLLISCVGNAQDSAIPDTVDAKTFLRNLFNMGEKKKTSKFTVLPSVSYNPTYGLSAGANATGVFKTGNPEITPLSVALANLYVSTKSVLNIQFRHNLFSGGGKFYFIGDIQLAKLVTPTYYTRDNDNKYDVRYRTFRFSERVYKHIKGPFYAGAGIAIELYGKINDEKLNAAIGETTPHYDYSLEAGIPNTSYNANGYTVNLLYYTMEHPVRSYGGIFADFVLRVNQEWMGSTTKAINLSTDIRKYWSLSTKNPEHVLAFWQLSTFSLNGNLPYINLPGTGLDQYNRGGRAFTFGRFKGPSFVYLESEYRFPITRNKLFSGVAFINMQSTSDFENKGLLNVIYPAAGAGLRVLLNKRTRSNLCLDYGIGLNGNNGFFFGLNEVF